MQIELTDIRTLADEEPRVAKYAYHDTPVTIGSHSANTLQIPDMEVASYHGLIMPTGDGDEDVWTFQPASPDAASQINGVSVNGPVLLEDGDTIRITHFELKFTVDVPPDLELPDPSNIEELAKIKQYPLPPRAIVQRGDEDLVLTPERISSLGSFAADLCTFYDIPTLLERSVSLLLSELQARSAWVGLRRSPQSPLEFVSGRSRDGKDVGEPWMLEGFVYRCMNRRQHILLPRTGQPETQSVIAVPVIGKTGVVGLLIADTRRRVRVMDESDLHCATAAARVIARLFEGLVTGVTNRRRQIEGEELAFLREVQARLDPRNAPIWPQIQIAAFAKPGQTASGDVYDITRLPNGLAAIMVGHATAKTARTAMAMTEVRSAFRLACMHADPPHILLRALGYLLFDETEPCRLDVAIMVMNPKTGALEYCTAGNIGLMVVDARGNPRHLVKEPVPPVGQERATAYTGTKERVKPGGTVAFYTEGCLSARDASGEVLDKDRLTDALCDVFGLPASNAVSDLVSDLAGFLKEGEHPADMTIVLVHRNSET